MLRQIRIGDHGGQQALGKARADHRGHLRQAARPLVQPVEPGDDQLFDPAGNGQMVERLGHGPFAGAIAAQAPRFPQVAHRLLQKEGRAGDAGDQGL